MQANVKVIVPMLHDEDVVRLSACELRSLPTLFWLLHTTLPQNFTYYLRVHIKRKTYKKIGPLLLRTTKRAFVKLWLAVQPQSLMGPKDSNVAGVDMAEYRLEAAKCHEKYLKECLSETGPEELQCWSIQKSRRSFSNSLSNFADGCTTFFSPSVRLVPPTWYGTDRRVLSW